MGRVLMTGFEAGSTGVCARIRSALGKPAISATDPRTGAYCLDVRSTIANAAFLLPEALTELYLRVGFKLTGAAYAKVALLSLGNGTQGTLVLATDAVGTLYVIQGTLTGTVLATVVGALPVDDWCCIEAHLVLDGAAGVAQVKVDGALLVDESAVNTGAAAWVVRLGNMHDSTSASSVAGVQGDFDDLAVNDTTGDENNSWIGRGGIYLGEVDGAGAVTQFTPDSGANWERVKDVPPDDDASYVESATYGHRDLYTNGGITPADGTISAVQVLARAKLTDVGVGNLRLTMRHGGLDGVSPDKTVDTSYRYRTHIWDLAPDDTAWSVAKVAALQIGPQVG